MTSASSGEHDTPPASPIHIVGIGASAGGLSALESFLAAVPSDSGMAYIVVQHRDRVQKDLLAELLQRVTPIPVCETRQGMRIQANAVFIVPPDTELRVVNQRLELSAPGEHRGLRLPINVLFSSLARAQGERAIAVLLSGMGSDGTLGMQAIKAVGGLTLVQDPGAAQFDTMPRSAIEAGCVDIIAAASELPAHLLAYVARESDKVAEISLQAAESDALQRVVVLLRQKNHHDFSLYKPRTLYRRIERRMAIHRLSSITQYAEFLERNTSEIDLLFKELLIGVTEFFRDIQTWKVLAESALPALLAERSGEQELRAWCVGCSTGEEPYSLAMVFHEIMERLPHPYEFRLQIFASDLNPDAIASARRGDFPASIADYVSADRVQRFFIRTDNGYRIREHLRNMVLFTQHDVILDPPFTRLDLIICRNLLIYFDPRLQRKLVPLFHYCLRDAGVLMLGSSETIGRSGDLFAAIDSRQRLYKRYGRASSWGPELLLNSIPPLIRQPKETSLPFRTTSNDHHDSLQTAADHVLLQVYAPAAVVLNREGDIVYISGRTGKYLEPAAGKANWNIHVMAREGLRAALGLALSRVWTTDGLVQLRSLQVETANGLMPVDVTVQALHTPSVLEGMAMVVFRDGSPAQPDGSKDDDGARTAYEGELHQFRDEILALRQETQSTREQLQTANEELQSANEELQSANEELTTSKEEMQSMNEELQAINSELQNKLDDLALAQSDLKNVINSIGIGILFLDRKLLIRRFTGRAAKIINLRDGDVGRPISELASFLQYPTIDEDARETLRTLQVSQKQVQTSDQRWFTVSIMPYHRIDDVIDGVVITMADITEIKRLENILRGTPGPG